MSSTVEAARSSLSFPETQHANFALAIRLPYYNHQYNHLAIRSFRSQTAARTLSLTLHGDR